MGIGERTHNEGLTTTQFVLGLKGSLGLGDWTFDLYGLKDDSDAVETIENLSLASRLNQLLRRRMEATRYAGAGSIRSGWPIPWRYSKECQEFMAPADVSTLNVDRDFMKAQ